MANFTSRSGAQRLPHTSASKPKNIAVSKCANLACTTEFRLLQEGRLFRADVEIGNLAGQRQCKTQYVWLCAHCAKTMEPRLDVSGNTVTLRLCLIRPKSTCH